MNNYIFNPLSCQGLKIVWEKVFLLLNLDFKRLHNPDLNGEP